MALPNTFNNRFNNKKNLNKKPNLINDEIRLPEFTLIDEQGNNLGKVKRVFALNKAAEVDLDLVLINDKAPNQVCKIMDYGKYLYDQKRKQRENKKNQTKIKIKEVKIKPQIGENDLVWNAKHVIEWIQDGCIVKVLVNTPGRISTKEELIFDVYNKLLSYVGGVVSIKAPLKKISSMYYEATLEPKKGK